MRKIEYLSPSSIAKYVEDKEAFYIRYLADRRLPDEPQTIPMSVGSAFDAYVKSYLHEKLFGKGHDPKFEFDALFSAQVESQNRDFALEAGKHCMDVYRTSGALADLLLELQQAVNVPKFEITIKGVVSGYREGLSSTIGSVTFLGKPDVFFINQYGANVNIDWKVNGYVSKYKKYPMKGYVRMRELTNNESGKFISGPHKSAMCITHNGILINVSNNLEDLNEDWARQLSIYSWLSGCEIGEDFIVGIDQLCCDGTGSDPLLNKPKISIAEHRLRISSEFQYKTFALAQEIWDVVHSDHFFRDMSKEDSQARCQILDQQAEGFMIENEQDRQFYELTKEKKRYF